MNKLIFINKNVDKKFFNDFLKQFLINFNTYSTLNLLDSLKQLGFKFATKGGISISIEDFKTSLKKKIINKSFYDIYNKNQNLKKEHNINSLHNSKIWNNANDFLKNNISKFFKNYDTFNNLYMISISGARGNMSQVHQMVGMRGLMSDNKGDLILNPILSNFREGIEISEYLISSFGARKGIVDTALRTADSGYLTRRLVECSYNILIRDIKCNSNRSINYNSLNQKNLCFNGHYTYLNYIDLNNKLNFKNFHLNTLNIIKNKLNKIYIRSPLTCLYKKSICQYCYGLRKINKSNFDLGKPIGIIAGQSLGEPATQMTMRTFHTGGTFMQGNSSFNQFNYSGFLNIRLYNDYLKLNLINFENKKIQIKTLLTKDLNQINSNLYIKKGTDLFDLNFSSNNFYQNDISFKIHTSKISGEVYISNNLKNYLLKDLIILNSSTNIIKYIKLIQEKKRINKKNYKLNLLIIKKLINKLIIFRLNKNLNYYINYNY